MHTSYYHESQIFLHLVRSRYSRYASVLRKISKCYIILKFDRSQKKKKKNYTSNYTTPPPQNSVCALWNVTNTHSAFKHKNTKAQKYKNNFLWFFVFFVFLCLNAVCVWHFTTHRHPSGVCVCVVTPGPSLSCLSQIILQYICHYNGQT